ncbi:uncharacterized protein C8Q71DRAFT_728181 [Rhodofomes roseus]|uniref:Uncharacterized protein n=1 Tax=Rhodofomes roseus TaxID=34475 RepID=A0ABQ8JYG5_9APHY|nr:uncharacterized protein C8Q71DRAFT_728181 [Rhodofomes roseus]KAH9829311.1 hypothetical protein C8Q71DRAFT_728181 [Rhodofomes roseus]
MDARLTAAITSPLRPCQTPSLRSFFDSMNRLSIHAKDRRPVTGERTIFTSGAFMEAMEYVSETSGEHGGIGRLRTRPPVAMFPLSQTSATKTVHEFVGAMYAVSAHGRVGPAGNQESRPGRTPTARGLIGIKAGRMEQPLARGMDDARSEETSREDGARGCEGETTCENKARSGVASQGEAGLEGKVTTVGGRKITAVSQRRGGYALTDFLQAMRRTVAMGPRRPAVESPQATVTDERIDERVVERPWEGDPEATTSPADTQKTVRPGFAESAAAQLSSSSKPGSLLGVAAGAVGPRISMLFKNHCLDYSLYRRFKAVVPLTSRYWSTTRLGVLPGGEDGHECGVANVVDAFEAAATQRERAMRATNGSMTIAAKRLLERGANTCRKEQMEVAWFWQQVGQALEGGMRRAGAGIDRLRRIL